MGNSAGKNKTSPEDIEYLMSKVEDKSLGTESTFYQLNFKDSGHTKERIKEWQRGEHNGLNKQQFLSMVTEFGIMGTPRNFDALFEGFDSDKDGLISLKEFVLLIHVMSDDTPEDKIKWGFNLYDENKDGYIDGVEMKRFVGTIFDLMKRQGDGESKAQDLLKKLDANHDGKVSQQEAIEACLKDEELMEKLNLAVNKHFHY